MDYYIGITYEQHHVVNVENVFEEVDRAAAIVVKRDVVIN